MATTKKVIKKKAVSKKIKVSYENSNGYEVKRLVTPEELRIMSRFINVTIE